MFNFHSSFFDIVFLSLYVSFIATIISFIFSVYLASLMAIRNFLFKHFFILLFNSLMSLPPVVVGLFLYLLFSASGVLGYLDLLYTPSLMVIAQFIIISPIIISLSYKILRNKYEYLEEYLFVLKTSDRKVLLTIINECRYDLLVIAIAGLGRALSEVGAVIIVGGNIAHLTRVMTTSIVLETSRGELELALSLGITLILISILINVSISIIKNKYL